MSTHADDLQHRLLREPARFVEDVRLTTSRGRGRTGVEPWKVD
jgi:hypothetical protein